MKVYTFIILAVAFLLGASAEQCGRQANGAVCPNGLCCSQHGWCGNTDDYCKNGCQSQCRHGGPTPTPSKSNPTPTPPPSHQGDVGRIISATLFDQMFKYRNDPQCTSDGFYTYGAFLAAARSFHGFGTTGDDVIRRRELAAFLAQTSHETTGGWPTAPDGPYAWGYCHLWEKNQAPYQSSNPMWPCAPHPKFYAPKPRRPRRIPKPKPKPKPKPGHGHELDLLNNPDQGATEATVSFKTAIGFWMTPQGNKPSSHDVIVGKWQPSDADRAAGRVPGYGVITNIINGGLECGHGPDDRVADRIGFYKRYCDMLGVSYGDNLDCNNQRPFA